MALFEYRLFDNQEKDFIFNETDDHFDAEDVITSDDAGDVAKAAFEEYRDVVDYQDPEDWSCIIAVREIEYAGLGDISPLSDWKVFKTYEIITTTTIVDEYENT
jgi:hypothetical protein